MTTDSEVARAASQGRTIGLRRLPELGGDEAILETCGENVEGARQSFRPSGHLDPRQKFARLDVEARQTYARAVGSLEATEQDQHGRRASMAWSYGQGVFNQAAEVLREFLPDERLLIIRRHNGQPLLDE